MRFAKKDSKPATVSQTRTFLKLMFEPTVMVVKDIREIGNSAAWKIFEGMIKKGHLFLANKLAHKLINATSGKEREEARNFAYAKFCEAYKKNMGETVMSVNALKYAYKHAQGEQEKDFVVAQLHEVNYKFLRNNGVRGLQAENLAYEIVETELGLRSRMPE